MFKILGFRFLGLWTTGFSVLGYKVQGFSSMPSSMRQRGLKVQGVVGSKRKREGSADSGSGWIGFAVGHGLSIRMLSM